MVSVRNALPRGASSQMHCMHVIDAAQFKRVVRQKSRKVVVVVAGQLVVQACQRITCGVRQPEARIARIAPTCRVRSVRCGKTCRTNNITLVLRKRKVKTTLVVLSVHMLSSLLGRI